MNLILFGAPGAGKGTQSQLLQQDFGLKPFSMGECLRQEIDRKTELGNKIKHLMDQGKLADRDTVEQIFTRKLDECPTNIIFDGFPRNLDQVNMLTNAIASRGLKIDAVIVINVTEDILIKRITGRYSCTSCGQIYNQYTHSTAVENTCDNCQGHSFGRRSDDNVDTLKGRLKTFESETRPVLEVLESNCKIVVINGDQSFEDVHQQIKQVVRQFSL